MFIQIIVKCFAVLTSSSSANMRQLSDVEAWGYCLSCGLVIVREKTEGMVENEMHVSNIVLGA